jgi:hypothetical protein
VREFITGVKAVHHGGCIIESVKGADAQIGDRLMPDLDDMPHAPSTMNTVSRMNQTRFPEDVE